MAGDETTIARVEGRQALGPRWVSHVLQALVVELLSDPLFEHPAAAGARCITRPAYEALLAALAERGIARRRPLGAERLGPGARRGSRHRRPARAHGWLALAGERFRIAALPGVRITVSTLRTEEAGELAEALAAAEHAGRPRRVY